MTIYQVGMFPPIDGEELTGINMPGSTSAPSSKVVAQTLAVALLLAVSYVFDLPVGSVPEFVEQGLAVVLASAVGYLKKEFRPGAMFGKL